MNHKNELRIITIFSLLFMMALIPHRNQEIQELITVSYSESDENFANPERGFYNWTEGVPGQAPLNAQNLASIREEGKSLIIRLYYIANFRDSDFPQTFLDQIEGDFAAMREAGIKSIIRFRYTKSQDDPDAPLERIEAHLDQLQPIFERNYDVISVAQAGFIGAWGEWHASANNLANTTGRRAVLFQFLDVLPKERVVQTRGPDYKWAIFDHNEPLTEEQAFDGSHLSRTGHHNDCFLASPTDVGTYHGLDIEATKEYLSQENKYLPMGGETCRLRDDAGDRYHCESAIEEMEWLRWSYMNSSYYAGILDHWRDNGCMPEIERRLGYRFVMREGVFSEEVRPGGSLHFDLEIENVGFASPYNPRGLQVIMRNAFDPDKKWIADLPEDPRLWMAGETEQLSHQLGIPEEMDDGFYELFLSLPDPTDSLRERSEYAIRTGNQRTWDEDTGYNNLNHLLIIDGAAGGPDHDGSLVFREYGTEIGTSTEESPGLPSRMELHQNFPNPFNPTTNIRFELPIAGEVRLTVYDVIGREVAVLANGRLSAGHHEIAFNASDLGSGTYIYRLQTGNQVQTRQMLFVK